jgi:hypothetical protein
MDLKNIKSKETVMKDEFKEIHKKYCRNFKKFYSKIDRTFQDNSLTHEEFDQMAQWVSEFKKLNNYIQLTFDEIDEQIKNKTLKLTNSRQKDNRIFKEVTDSIMPIALAYWMTLETNETN